MTDVGHIPQIEDPDAFNAVLLAAIGELVSAGTALPRAGQNQEPSGAPAQRH
jgi:hypothetical protein